MTVARAVTISTVDHMRPGSYEFDMPVLGNLLKNELILIKTNIKRR